MSTVSGTVSANTASTAFVIGEKVAVIIAEELGITLDPFALTESTVIDHGNLIRNPSTQK